MNEKQIKRDFGIALKKIRQEKQLSQEALSEISGIHRTYISEVERGDRNISLINIIKLCNSLNVTVSYLFLLIEKEVE